MVCGGEEDGEFVLYGEGATIGEVRVDGGDKLFLDEAMLVIDIGIVTGLRDDLSRLKVVLRDGFSGLGLVLRSVMIEGA